MFSKIRNWLFHEDLKKQNLAAFVMLVGSGLGLLASFVLSIESLELAKNSHAVLSCDFSSALSCSAVANHWSAAILGFPNSFIGVMTLPVMVTIAVALLAGTKFPRWFMFAAQIGVSVGFIFALWMFYMSFVEIGVLCPWCLTLDVGMLLIFGSMTRYNILTGVITGKKVKKFVQNDYDIVLLMIIIALAVVMILVKFGDQLL
ncbi:vitamin K epoxide reductase family protein [Candidatus Nanosynbacter sp. TM7-076]|uniref:vitamin K epoxide reductase family protein n=1 Tax=Candidatus Nanosynbacter sp. TM7-076 TaxID=2902629 RepID=UPI001FB6B549|nr:vitamin K epoxide reductase family protein [Candidatus Nanosynbacter sp. TM7-076]MCJ1967543.1 vitamin K epoxide reductase family protein [Candidatus Nanosynbacter sp. TM7-076]